jgi:hypothetical protein
LNGKSESVIINSVGPMGSLIARGIVGSADGRFTSSIRFYDTQKVIQPNLYSTRFRLKNVVPRVLLRNTTAGAIVARPRFLPESGANPVELPDVKLGPNETAEVNLAPLTAAVEERSDLDDASIQIINNGAPGSLIGAMYGEDKTTGIVYDVPLRDSGPVRSSAGGYPVRLDGDYSTIISITNVSEVPTEFIAQVNYEGGPYLLRTHKLLAGETATFDFRKIRDEQTPDWKGRTLPASFTHGQFRWGIHGGGASARLTGRAEILSLSKQVSSSYSCGVNCAPSYKYQGDILNNDPISVGGISPQALIATEMDVDCYGNVFGPNQMYDCYWESLTPGIAITQYPGYGSFIGIAPGFASIRATWQAPQYNCEADCVESYVPAESSTDMLVLRITLQKGDGSSLPSPLRVGVTANGHDRKQQLRAVVEPAEEASNVTISVSSKLSSSDVSTSNGAITFKVVGTTESDSEGDQTITARHSTGMTTTHPATVAIPRKIGTPHPTFSGTVTGVNFIASRTSVPPFPEITEGKVWLYTLYTRTINVLVWDKWGKPIGDLYSGATIKEFDIDIGVTLTSSSTYPDIVGTGVLRDYPLPPIDYDPPPASPANTWLTDSPKLLPVGDSRTQTIPVKVDGFPLDPSVVGRTWTATPPNTLVITWP